MFPISLKKAFYATLGNCSIYLLLRQSIRSSRQQKGNARDEFEIHRQKKPKDTCKTHYGDGATTMFTF